MSMFHNNDDIDSSWSQFICSDHIDEIRFKLHLALKEYKT